MNQINADELRVLTAAVTIIDKHELLDKDEIAKLGKRTLKLALQTAYDMIENEINKI